MFKLQNNKLHEIENTVPDKLVTGSDKCYKDTKPFSYLDIRVVLAFY